MPPPVNGVTRLAPLDSALIHYIYLNKPERAGPPARALSSMSRTLTGNRALRPSCMPQRLSLGALQSVCLAHDGLQHDKGSGDELLHSTEAKV